MAQRPAAHTIRTLAFAALLLTLGLVLPFLTGQIPQFGSMLLPMHLPVLLCGFVCSWPWGLAVGAVTPLLRSLLFAMPPMFPTALAMAFELAAYGCCTGLLYRRLPRTRRCCMLRSSSPCSWGASFGRLRRIALPGR